MDGNVFIGASIMTESCKVTSIKHSQPTHQVLPSPEPLAVDSGKRALSPIPGGGGIPGWRSFVQGVVYQTRIFVCGGLGVDMDYSVESGRSLWRWSGGDHGYWLASGMAVEEISCSKRMGSGVQVIFFSGFG
jgi:hypothetical protein